MNARNPDGASVLLARGLLGRAEVVDLLLKGGADRNARNNAGQTPLDVTKADSISRNQSPRCSGFRSAAKTISSEAVNWPGNGSASSLPRPISLGE